MMSDYGTGVRSTENLMTNIVSRYIIQQQKKAQNYKTDCLNASPQYSGFRTLPRIPLLPNRFGG